MKNSFLTLGKNSDHVEGSAKTMFSKAILSILVIISFSSVTSSLAEVPSYTDDQVWNKLQSGGNSLIIDIRSSTSYSEGHIPTAINLQFDLNIDQTLVDTIISYGRSENILYCSCVEGASARSYAEQLANLGLDNVYYMSDDFRDWPYQIITGSEPGTISINPDNSTTIIANNNDTPNMQISNLIYLNLFLGLIVVVIIIWKKRHKL